MAKPTARPRAKGTFAGVTFVDGVATELDDLGRLPDDPTFQGTVISTTGLHYNSQICGG